MRQGRPGRRHLLLLAVAGYALALLLLAFLLERASPGPAGQDLQGVGIGSYGSDGGIAYISGRQLHCEPTAHAGYTSRCTVTVAGKALELFARRNPPQHPNQLGGACEARYAGTIWPCRVGSRHVHVHWFAFIDQPLGLGAVEVDAVRRAHLFQNAPQDTYVAGILVVPVLSALVAAGGLGGWLVAGACGWLKAGAAALLSGVAAFAGTFLLTMWATVGYWD
ncbi:MAG TPA: hypothetical protein VHS99_14880 [Chloroflexota bacterium]|nr:hypothetical protein [Chloroflexota bacterium]